MIDRCFRACNHILILILFTIENASKNAINAAIRIQTIMIPSTKQPQSSGTSIPGAARPPRFF